MTAKHKVSSTLARRDRAITRPTSTASSNRRRESKAETALAKARDDIKTLPFEVEEQVKALNEFLSQPYPIQHAGKTVCKTLGQVKWGIYAFFDYDDEPIYVGQTKESLRTRIGRHLTGRRSDAVAKNILDPFEVCTVRVYPVPKLQMTSAKDKTAKGELNSLEHAIYHEVLKDSKFGAVLNEQVPIAGRRKVTIPGYKEQRIASEKMTEFRGHPDIRIARRAQTLAALARGISERKVGLGIRRTLWVQAQRLEDLAKRRLERAPDSGIREVTDEDEAGKKQVKKTKPASK